MINECGTCKRTFSTPQGLGLHWRHGTRTGNLCVGDTWLFCAGGEKFHERRRRDGYRVSYWIQRTPPCSPFARVEVKR